MNKTAPEIHVLNHKVKLLQALDGFRTSMDSVFLAAACKAKAGDSVLDMGTGVGGAAFCLYWRVPNCKITGVEIQKSHADLAVENISLNNANEFVDIVCADIRAYAPPSRFDHVICNPPYLEAGEYTPSPLPERAMALGHKALSPTGRGLGEGEQLKTPLPNGEREGVRGASYKQKPPEHLVEFAKTLRKNQTDAETKLWMLLRDRRFLGLKFKRQHSILPYIVDFVCLDKKIIVELDGGQHDGNKKKDQKRTDFLNSLGFDVVRFWNNDVLENIEGILIELSQILKAPSSNLLPVGEKALIMDSPLPIGEKAQHIIPLPHGEREGVRGNSVVDEGAEIYKEQNTMTLNDWIMAAFNNLKSGGTFTIIHRADMVDKIILGMGKKFGAIEIIPLLPRMGVEAKRVIVRAIKDRKTPSRLFAGLVLHHENGDYTDIANAILRDGAPIEQG